MILIAGDTLDISTITNQYSENSIERQLLDKMAASTEQYEYDSLNILMFELRLRKEIIKYATELNNSNLFFADFDKSRCNPLYWQRTDNGGFHLKTEAKPSAAINDIFNNGSEYATECATAIMIVYYKALLSVFHEDAFNKLFPSIYLMDWDVTEPLLKEVVTPRKVKDMLIGDRGYFFNPDVDPAFPEWQGENVFVLPDSMYYGHGIGIATSEDIINALNAKRKKNATQSAYLLDSVGRPNFKELYNAYLTSTTQIAPLVWKPFPTTIFNSLCY